MAKDIWMNRGFICKIDDEDWDLISDAGWYIDKVRLKNFDWSHYVFTNEQKVIKDYSKEPRTQIYLHRVIMARMVGRKLTTAETVDHIDHDGLNNRRENLRLCARNENAKNQRVKDSSLSGINGIHWHKKREKWCVQAKKNGKQSQIGEFKNLIDAAICRHKWATREYGEFYDPRIAMKPEIYQQVMERLSHSDTPRPEVP